MTIKNQSKYNSAMFLDDLEPLELTLTTNERPYPVNIIVYTEEGSTIFTESYLADFDGKIIMDIASLFSSYFSYSVPAAGAEIAQSEAVKGFKIQVGYKTSASATSYLSLAPTVFACAKAAELAISDIDILRIPRDYILPICCFHQGNHQGVDFLLPDKTETVEDFLVSASGNTELVSRLEPLSATPAVSADSFQIRIVGREIYGPRYLVCSEHFEQYLFLNRFGGFDNIAMSGDLSLQAETKHESGLFSGQTVQQESSSVKKYSQNSGFMSKKTVEAFAELVCSSQIYHLVGGVWKRIVVIESDIKCNSGDDLNSFSFKFSYTDSAKTAYYSFAGGSSGGDSGAYDIEYLVKRIAALEEQHEVLTEEQYQAKLENGGIEDKIYLTYES